MAIADTITSMQNHTSNAYDILNYATDLTGTNKNLANLKQTIFNSIINTMNNKDSVFNALPKITTTAGTSQSINNTIEAPMRISLSPSELTQNINVNTTGIRLGLYQIADGNYASPDSSNRYSTVNDLVKVKPNTTYTTTTQTNINAQFYLLEYNSSKSYTANSSSAQSVKSYTFTTGATTEYIAIDIRAYDATNYQISYVGDIIINQIPTPSSACDIHTISGDNTISVCGKNLFDGEWEVGYININTGEDTGTGTANVRTKNYIRIQPNTQYSISNTYNHDTWAVYYDKTKTFISNQQLKSGTSGSFTTPNNPSIYYVRWYDAASTGNTPQWQLELGSTASTYEAYNGTDYSVNLSSKNYLNVPSNYSLTEYQTINVNIPAGTYILSAENRTSTADSSLILFQNGSTTLSQKYISANNLEESVTLSTNADKILIYSGNNYASSVGVETTFTNLMISVDGGEYAPYFAPIEYCKIGTYADRIFRNVEGDPDYDSNLTGVWYIKKNIGKVVLDGSETYLTWGLKDTNYFSAYVNKLTSNPAVVNGNILSDYFPFSNYGVVANATGEGCFTGGGYIGVSIAKSLLSDTSTQANALASIKTWFTNNNAIFYYQLATPTYTKITGTLAEQLESLYNAQSKDGMTNISQTNNDLPFIIGSEVLENLNV